MFVYGGSYTRQWLPVRFCNLIYHISLQLLVTFQVIHKMHATTTLNLIFIGYLFATKTWFFFLN